MMATKTQEARHKVLQWFAERDARGSQTNFHERALQRASEEIAPSLSIDVAYILKELQDLRLAGFIETKQGQGPFRGAWVTSITQRGRDAIFSQNEQPQTMIDTQQKAKHPNEIFRNEVLQVVYDRFHAGSRHLQIQDFTEPLRLDSGIESAIKIANALRYWSDAGAIAIKEIRTDSDFPVIAVVSISSVGSNIIERGEAALGGSTTVHQHVNATNIGVLGNMSGGIINQSSGAQVVDLVTALEKLRDQATLSNNTTAVLIENTTDQLITEMHSTEPRPGKIEKIFAALADAIRTVGELGPAWSLVALEAAKVGIKIPLPPSIGH